ncbi:uncharacterized protein CEXT_312151 [Caerostris extrusa]|uniref:Uncharacterized protein n=1 Tax=Caerostris extrusa TaxID=172846 RepID=A0AAV4T2R3_CAEEX|nr:uncharacterized protein CEXT_312151 [Caerostris extrusa]
MNFTDREEQDMATRKQELSLTLTPSTPFKTMFIDETPTPTRFLNALESEMFQEFNNDNPFDATFRKANSSNNGPHSLNIPESATLIASLPDSEVLNTPSITLPNTLPFSPDEKLESREINAQTIGNSDLSSTEDANFPSVEQNRSIVFINEQNSILKTNASRSTVVQTPVITSIGNSPLAKSSAAGVPTAVVVPRPTNSVRNLAATQIPVVTEKNTQIKVAEQPQAVVQSVCVTPMVQVMIRLPDGQTMPVQFPVMASAPTAVPVVAAVPVNNAPEAAAPTVKTNVPIVTSVVTPVTQLLQTVTSTESQVSSSVTKMKLKEVLTLNEKNSTN